jgi:hypothetical protein
MKTRMHKNSLKAYTSLKLERVERVALLTFQLFGPSTDRRATTMQLSGTGSLQPRITSLLARKLLKEIDHVKCPQSGRTVRLCKITKLGIKALAK